MICFYTNKSEIYCKIIHNYLKIEIFEKANLDIGDIIEKCIPKYLFREQYQKCINVFCDLYEWTKDPFLHELTAFHEIALYYFLEYMNDVKKNMQEEFKKIYYDENLKKEIEKYSKLDFKKEKNEFLIEEFREVYYSPSDFCDEILEDLDFLELPHIYNEQKNNFPILAETLGIDLDYYFEILPVDIQKQYKSKHITLTGEISDFFWYLQETINNGSLDELFWEKDNPVTERKIHVIIENIMNAYFIGKNMDISREVLLKNGQVDFKIFKNTKKNEKVLIEVKKASSSYLKAGYKNQLCKYIGYSGYKNAFYLIVCFTDKDYKTANNFIKNNIYTDTYQMYINIAILDVRKKPFPSKIKKDDL